MRRKRWRPKALCECILKKFSEYFFSSRISDQGQGKGQNAPFISSAAETELTTVANQTYLNMLLMGWKRHRICRPYTKYWPRSGHRVTHQNVVWEQYNTCFFNTYDSTVSSILHLPTMKPMRSPGQGKLCQIMELNIFCHKLRLFLTVLISGLPKMSLILIHANKKCNKSCLKKTTP